MESSKNGCALFLKCPTDDADCKLSTSMCVMFGMCLVRVCLSGHVNEATFKLTNRV